MNRAFSKLEIKSVDEDRRELSGWATTPQIDRVNDIIDPLGCTFANPAVLLWQHQHDAPIGTVTFDAPTAQGVRFTARIPKVSESSPFKDRVDEAWAAVKYQVVRSVSIGFRALPNGYEPLPNGGIRYTSIEILELSLVSVAANPGAQIVESKAHRGTRVVKLSDPVSAKIDHVVKLSQGLSASSSRPSRLSTPAEIRAAITNGKLSEVIDRDRKWMVDNAPFQVAVDAAKGVAEIKRVAARFGPSSEEVKRAVKLTAGERRLAGFVGGTGRYGR